MRGCCSVYWVENAKSEKQPDGKADGKRSREEGGRGMKGDFQLDNKEEGISFHSQSQEKKADQRKRPSRVQGWIGRGGGADCRRC